jgi:hypothetical protein
MTAFSTEFAGRAMASNDLDLVHAAQNGDVSAFEQLVGDTIANSSELPNTSHAIGKIPRTWFRRAS